MKKILVFIFLISSLTAFGQFVKSTGIVYYEDKASLDAEGAPPSYAAEIAITVDLRKIWQWNGTAWEELKDYSSGSGVPSGDPGTGAKSYLNLLTGDWYKWTGAAWVSSAGGVTDHGLLSGLSDDDHPQYHNDARADTWLSTKDSDDITQGATNKYYPSSDQAKLAAIEPGATSDQTAGEIKTLYESNADTNAFTDSEQSKLTGIESGATSDQTNSEIETAYNNQVPIVSQAHAEAGTSTTVYRWTPERVAQAIAALGGGGGGTDDQVIDTLSLSGTVLQISLEGDGQPLKTIDLVGIDTDTDNQTIDVLSFDGTSISLSLEDDGEATQIVDISSVDTDTQLDETAVDGFVANNGYLTSEVDGSTSNEIQTIDVSTFDGTNISLSLSSDGEATKTIDISSVDTDTQLNESQVESFIDGDETAFDGWDKDSSNDFDGAYSNLTGTPTIPIIDNTAYGATWSGNLDGATKGALYTKIEALIGGAADGNGIFDAANDGGVVSTSFDFSITDSLTIGAVKFGSTGNMWDVGTLNTHTIPAGTGTIALTSQLFDGVFSSLSGIPAGLSDGDDDTQLNETQVDAFVANNGYLTTEVDGSITNELQDFDLTNLSGTTLQLSLTDDATQHDVDLSPLQDGTGTDDQTIDVFNITSDILNLSLESDGEATKTVDLSSYLDDTVLSEATVDSYANNNGYLTSEVDGSTSNELQTIDVSSFDGTNISLSLSNDGEATKTIDISSVDTDTQLNEGQVDSYVSNNGYLTSETDDQTIDQFSITTNTLSISLEDDGEAAKTVDLSPYLDDTVLSEATVDSYADNNGYLTSEVDGSISNELQDFDVTNLSGTDLELSLTQDATTHTIDLSSLQDGTGTDDQTASEVNATDAGGYFTGTELEAISQELGADVVLNNAKVTNVTTNLSEGTTTTTTVDINSSDGTNATLLAASTSRAGVMTKAKFDEVEANNTKNTYPSGDASKLSGIEGGAEVNVQSDWNAGSGDAQILNKPSIPTVDDTSYDGTWNANTDAPTKNAIYDKIESISAGDVSSSIGSTTDLRLAVFDGTGGKTITDTPVKANSSGDLTSISNLTMTGLLTTTGNITLATPGATIDSRDLTTDGSKLDGIEAGADITDATNVTSAGALMDSEIDADLKTLSLPASTTISTFGASVVDDANASAARTTLDVDQAGTDNSTNVSFAGTPDYITIAGQVITRGAIDLANDITGVLDESNIDADIARDSELPTIDDTAYNATSWNGNSDGATKNAIRDKIEALPGGHDAVTLTGSGTYLSLSNQEITVDEITASDVTDFDTEVANNSAVTLNTAKVTNATHTGDVTGSTSLTIASTAITGKTLVTASQSDHILIADDSDSDNLKKVLVSTISPIIFAYKDSDESRSSTTTLTDDSDLDIAVDINSYYKFNCVLLTNGHATPDFDIKFDVPTGSSLYWNYAAFLTTPNTETTEYFMKGFGSDQMITFSGILVTGGTAGNITLTWAQNVSSANNSTILEGSNMVLTKLN